MARIQPLSPAEATGAVADALTAVKAKLGFIPNLVATLARAPAALHTYLGSSQGLAKGRLTARQREIVALAVAQFNGCQYCLSVHTLTAKNAGLTEEDIRRARDGDGTTPEDQAIAAFAKQVVSRRGFVSDEDLAALRRAGFDEVVALEIVANVAHNTLTNYANHVAGTDLDFPRVEIESSQSAA